MINFSLKSGKLTSGRPDDSDDFSLLIDHWSVRVFFDSEDHTLILVAEDLGCCVAYGVDTSFYAAVFVFVETSFDDIFSMFFALGGVDLNIGSLIG